MPWLTCTSGIGKEVLTLIWWCFQLSCKEIYSRIKPNEKALSNKNVLILFFGGFKSDLVCISSAQIHYMKTIGHVASRVFPQLVLEWLGDALWTQSWIKHSNSGLRTIPCPLHLRNVSHQSLPCVARSQRCMAPRPWKEVQASASGFGGPGSITPMGIVGNSGTIQLPNGRLKASTRVFYSSESYDA